ncbi:presenilin-associated rhomboid-like protein, mitochondrial isoform X2 [Narcine bancroftii]|uniref:presenilin-associated rhomboid-like protein, mitochondrial isoform X2 n=1 Tax=Narcine bancroftii TaxID=1343680 RepID=UPI003831D598
MASVYSAMAASPLLWPGTGRQSRLIFHTVSRRGFRKAPKNSEPRKVEPENTTQKDLASSVNQTSKSSLTPVLEEPVISKSASLSFRRLVKPFVFTVGVNQWWNSLTEGQRTVTGIIAVNALVFCLWRIPSMQWTMVKYFTSNPASKTLCLPMVLSAFSHYSFFHMAANMYVLWSFSSSIVSLLGQEQFMAVYLSAGVISTFSSYLCKTATGRLGASLGASGAIMAILAAVCSKMPEAKLAIILLPMFTFTASSALKAIIAIDSAGLILGWRFFDHAAHLGGALFGIWYIFHGHELIWKKREPLVKVWHNLRTKGPGSGGNGPS